MLVNCAILHFHSSLGQPLLRSQLLNIILKNESLRVTESVKRSQLNNRWNSRCRIVIFSAKLHTGHSSHCTHSFENTQALSQIYTYEMRRDKRDVYRQECLCCIFLKLILNLKKMGFLFVCVCVCV